MLVMLGRSTDMAGRTIRADKAEPGDLVKLLRRVARGRSRVTIILPGEDVVTVEPAAPLKPLPLLEGTIPEG